MSCWDRGRGSSIFDRGQPTSTAFPTVLRTAGTLCCSARLRLLQRERDLLVRVPRLPHVPVSCPQTSKGRKTLTQLGWKNRRDVTFLKCRIIISDGAMRVPEGSIE